MLRHVNEAASKDMLANANIKSFWVHPTQRAASKNYSRRGVISVRCVSTLATVPTFAQDLLFYLTAFRTRLRGVARIYFFVSKTGACSLVLQYRQEAGPAGVRHRSRQSVILDHPSDVQALHRKSSVAANQVHCDFVMCVSSRIRDFQVQPRNGSALFRSTARSFFLPAQAALSNSEFTEVWLNRLERGDMLAVAGRQEAFETDIDADARLVGVDDRHIGKLARRRHIPLARFPLDVESLHRSFERAMQVDPHKSYVLKPQLVADDTSAVTDRGKSDRIKAISRLESRITGLFASFAAAKERFESLVQVAHCRLSGRKVEPGVVGIHLAIQGEPRGLLDVLDSALGYLVGFFALRKAVIIETAVSFEGYLKLPRLIHIWLEPVAKGLKHLLAFINVASIYVKLIKKGEARFPLPPEGGSPQRV